MISSMTGYGRAEGRFESTEILVEIRSVNSRYCEVSAKLPRLLVPYEQDLKRQVQRRFARGRFDVTIALNGGGGERSSLELNRELARTIYRGIEELRKMLDLEEPVRLDHLTGFRELFTMAEGRIDAEKLQKAVAGICEKAMCALERMRQDEGRTLSRDLGRRLRKVEANLGRIEAKAPQIARAYGERLRRRIRKLIGDVALDETRILQEIAVAAERCDVSEEVVRLRSHLRQYATLVKGPEPSGRRLDFLLQEMNREVNTIGSKAGDAAVARWVVDLKAELEKIREQVQNIE